MYNFTTYCTSHLLGNWADLGDDCLGPGLQTDLLQHSLQPHLRIALGPTVQVPKVPPIGPSN